MQAPPTKIDNLIQRHKTSLQKKEENLYMVREQQMRVCTFKPVISDKSRKLAEKRESDGSVSQRKIITNSEVDCTFKPLTNKAKSPVWRKQDVPKPKGFDSLRERNQRAQDHKEEIQKAVE